MVEVEHPDPLPLTGETGPAETSREIGGVNYHIERDNEGTLSIFLDGLTPDHPRIRVVEHLGLDLPSNVLIAAEYTKKLSGTFIPLDAVLTGIARRMKAENITEKATGVPSDTILSFWHEGIKHVDDIITFVNARISSDNAKKYLAYDVVTSPNVAVTLFDASVKPETINYAARYGITTLPDLLALGHEGFGNSELEYCLRANVPDLTTVRALRDVGLKQHYVSSLRDGYAEQFDQWIRLTTLGFSVTHINAYAKMGVPADQSGDPIRERFVNIVETERARLETEEGLHWSVKNKVNSLIVRLGGNKVPYQMFFELIELGYYPVDLISYLAPETSVRCGEDPMTIDRVISLIDEGIKGDTYHTFARVAPGEETTKRNHYTFDARNERPRKFVRTLETQSSRGSAGYTDMEIRLMIKAGLNTSLLNSFERHHSNENVDQWVRHWLNDGYPKHYRRNKYVPQRGVYAMNDPEFASRMYAEQALCDTRMAEALSEHHQNDS